MKITFLGTNGWYNHDNQETSCVLVESKKFNLILDLGSGIKNLNKLKFQPKETFIFISHLHLDHIIGIHYLSSILKLGDIKIVLHKKYIKYFKSIFNKIHKFKIFGIRLILFLLMKINIPKFQLNLLQKNLRIQTHLGYKFFLEKIISYCTDTKYCTNLIKLSSGSDY